MKKYLSFNDINLFFIFKVILTYILITIYIILNLSNFTGDGGLTIVLFSMTYIALFVLTCWILFFINLFVQKNNSRKRKKQNPPS